MHIRFVMYEVYNSFFFVDSLVNLLFLSLFARYEIFIFVLIMNLMAII